MQRQQSLASAALPLTLRHRPRADLWSGEGMGGHGQNDNEEIGAPAFLPAQLPPLTTATNLELRTLAPFTWW